MTTTLTNQCGRCGRTIELRPINATSENHRWYSGTKQDSWRCGTDPDWPLRSHDPLARPEQKPIEQVERETAETVAVALSIREADRRHEYESPRGDSLPVGGCAVCGLYQEAGSHS